MKIRNGTCLRGEYRMYKIQTLNKIANIGLELLQG